MTTQHQSKGTAPLLPTPCNRCHIQGVLSARCTTTTAIVGCHHHSRQLGGITCAPTTPLHWAKAPNAAQKHVVLNWWYPSTATQCQRDRAPSPTWLIGGIAHALHCCAASDKCPNATHNHTASNQWCVLIVTQHSRTNDAWPHTAAWRPLHPHFLAASNPACGLQTWERAMTQHRCHPHPIDQ